MKLLYPAIFYPCEEKKGYTVVVPDLPGCVSEGDSLADPILMGGQMPPAAGFADFCSMPVTAISSKFPNHAFFHAKMYCIYRAKAHYRLFSIFLHFYASIFMFYHYFLSVSLVLLTYLFSLYWRHLVLQRSQVTSIHLLKHFWRKWEL